MSAITLSPGVFLNTNLLQVFMLVAEHRSFKEAALRSGRSQSAISAQIRQLESQLGVQILHRTTRSVALTSAGETLFHAARQSLHILDMAVEQLHADSSRARVSLVATSSMACTFMPQVLKKFARRHPEVRVEMEEMRSPLMRDPLLSGRFSCGIGPISDIGDGLTVEPLVDDPLIALLRRDHPLADQGPLELSVLARIPLMLPRRGSASRSLLEGAARLRGISLDVQYEGMQFYTLKTLVREGLGVAILPLTTVFADEPEDLVALPIADLDLERPVALITNPNIPRSEATTAFLAAVRREALDWQRRQALRLA